MVLVQCPVATHGPRCHGCISTHCNEGYDSTPNSLSVRNISIAKSGNTMLQRILNSDALYTSQMYQHWRSVL